MSDARDHNPLRELVLRNAETAKEALKASWLARALQAPYANRKRLERTRADVAVQMGVSKAVVARLELDNDYARRMTLDRFLDLSIACGLFPKHPAFADATDVVGLADQMLFGQPQAALQVSISGFMNPEQRGAPQEDTQRQVRWHFLSDVAGFDQAGALAERSVRSWVFQAGAPPPLEHPGRPGTSLGPVQEVSVQMSTLTGRVSARPRGPQQALLEAAV